MTDLKHPAEPAQIADHVEARLREACAAAPGEVAITVPGGSTPFPIFEELARRDLPWERIVVRPGDDRVVPEDHGASNIGRIRAVFEPLGARVEALAEKAQPPRFALTWLGMGADGHVASLFPNTDPQVDDPLKVRRLTPDPLPPEAPFDRITMTLPALLDTDAILFTLGGSQDKRAVFEAALDGEHDLPVARLLREAERRSIKVTCFA